MVQVHSSKSRMNETSTPTHVHVAYSHIAFVNYQWTINLHDGYPSLHVLLQEVHPTLSSHLLQFFVYHVSLW